MSEFQLTRVETFPFAYGAIRDACKENGNTMPHYQTEMTLPLFLTRLKALQKTASFIGIT